MVDEVLVSVITTVRNGELFILETLRSVLNQSYPYYEHIIVDDGSADSTIQIVEKFKEANGGHKITLICTNGIGRGEALNLAVSNASGNWIAVIDADDLWHTDKLKLQVEIVSQYNMDVLASASSLFTNSTQISFTDIKPYEVKKILKEKLIKSNNLSHSSVIIRKELCKYDGSRKSQLDYELWLRLITQNFSLFKVSAILTYHRIHENQSFEGKMGKIYRWRSYRLKMAYSIFPNDVLAMFYNTCKLSIDMLFPRDIRFAIKKTHSMNIFLTIIFSLAILLTPIYVFPSGLPQPADILGAVGFIYIIFTKKILTVISIKVHQKLWRFIGLVCLINLLYYLYNNSIGLTNTMYFVNLFYIFNGLFFSMTIIYISSDFAKSVNVIALMIMICLFYQCAFGILGIRGGGTSRNAIFFNNPNQLGYFSLASLSIFAVLPSVYRKNKLTLFFTISMSSYLILLSGSRAALVGVLLLTLIVFIKEGFKFDVRSIISLMVAVTLISIVIVKTSFVENQLDSIERRTENKASSNVSEWKIRGYDRFNIHTEYIFYGAGEGLNSRWKSYHNLEMHSGIGTILFSYGILGLALFAIFVLEVSRRNMFINILLLTPLLLYNLTHQGLRNSQLWVCFACIAIVSEMEFIQKKKVI